MKDHCTVLTRYQLKLNLEAEPENQFVPQVGVIDHVNLYFLYILINNGGQSTEPSTVSGD